MSLVVGREKRRAKLDVEVNSVRFTAAFNLPAVSNIAPSCHGFAAIRRRIRGRRRNRTPMAPTAQTPLSAFGSSVAFIGAVAAIPLESRL